MDLRREISSSRQDSGIDGRNICARKLSRPARKRFSRRSLGRITTLFDEDEPVCVEMYGGEVDRSWWTAAVKSLLSPEFRRALVASGVFHDEISTVQANRREWPYGGCQASLASIVKKRAVPSAWFLQARQCVLRRRAGEGV